MVISKGNEALTKEFNWHGNCNIILGTSTRYTTKYNEQS